jgi:hypothetical protein
VDLRFERRVAQNTAIETWALWSCAVRFDQAVGPERGLELPFCFLVLPMVLHASTAKAISGLQMTEGSFYRALTQNRTIMLGLQSRVRSLADDTLHALNLAFPARLLRLDKAEQISVFPGRKTLPPPLTAAQMSEDVTQIIGASRRLGYWFATNELSVVCSLLKVRF